MSDSWVCTIDTVALPDNWHGCLLVLKLNKYIISPSWDLRVLEIGVFFTLVGAKQKWKSGLGSPSQ